MAGSREGAGGKKGVQAEVSTHEAPRVGRSSGHRGRESKGEVPTRSESSWWARARSPVDTRLRTGHPVFLAMGRLCGIIAGGVT